MCWDDCRFETNMPCIEPLTPRPDADGSIRRPTTTTSTVIPGNVGTQRQARRGLDPGIRRTDEMRWDDCRFEANMPCIEPLKPVHAAAGSIR